jgi:hypothetical protein
MMTFTRAGKSIRAMVAIVGLAASSLGCAFGEIRWDDPMGRLYALEEAQMYYSQLVRFGDFHTALRFVDPELQDQYLDRVDMGLRFTDMQSGPINLDTLKLKSNVTVRYMGYNPNTMVELRYTEKQAWHRKPNGGNGWVVRPYFVDIEAEPPARETTLAKAEGSEEGDASASEDTSASSYNDGAPASDEEDFR